MLRHEGIAESSYVVVTDYDDRARSRPNRSRQLMIRRGKKALELCVTFLELARDFAGEVASSDNEGIQLGQLSHTQEGRPLVSGG